MSESEFELVAGSGNVFRDFAEPDADLKQAKAIVAARIIAELDERGLTVRKAEEATGFAAADFSRIRNANLGRFTLDRLMKILAALDGRIRVTVHSDLGSRSRIGEMLRPGREPARRMPCPAAGAERTRPGENRA